MKKDILAAALVMSLVAPIAISAQTRAANSALGSVTLNHKVKADGQPLAAGTYTVRLTDEAPPKPGVGQTAEAERYVEFVKGGKVVAKEVATVISDADVKTVVKGPSPARGGVRVDMLKGNDYVRVWINRGGNNYLINLPAGA
jgi:hypothetical protein